MPNFFKSFFSGKSETPESEKQKNDRKRFEIFKYDGLRAQRMGRPDYAVKCFTEALAIEEDFETMGYLSQLYIQTGETEKARELLEKHRERLRYVLLLPALEEEHGLRVVVPYAEAVEYHK